MGNYLACSMKSVLIDGSTFFYQPNSADTCKLWLVLTNQDYLEIPEKIGKYSIIDINDSSFSAITSKSIIIKAKALIFGSIYNCSTTYLSIPYIEFGYDGFRWPIKFNKLERLSIGFTPSYFRFFYPVRTLELCDTRELTPELFDDVYARYTGRTFFKIMDENKYFVQDYSGYTYKRDSLSLVSCPFYLK